MPMNTSPTTTTTTTNYGTVNKPTASINILKNYADVINSTYTGNKQVILKAIEDLDLTKTEAISIRNALQGNSSAQLGSDEKLLTVYNAMNKLKDDHRSYFHLGDTESYKVAYKYIETLATTQQVGSIKGAGYGEFFLNRHNYEMHLDEIIKKIKNGSMISEGNKHVFIPPDRLAQIERNIIEYRNSLRNSPSFFQFPTSPPRMGMSLPPQIIAVIEEIPWLPEALREDIWNILVEAMIDRAGLTPLNPQVCANMIALAEAYIIVNNIFDGQLVSNYTPLQKLYTTVNNYWSNKPNAGFQPFSNSIKVNDSNATINITNKSAMEQKLKDSGISVRSGY